MTEKYLNDLRNYVLGLVPEEKNDGHNKLMQDLTDLWKDAFEYQYHDFKNTKYAAPKMALKNRLEQIISLAVNGKYDN